MAAREEAPPPVLVEWCAKQIVARAIDAGVAKLGERVEAARERYQGYRRRCSVLELRGGFPDALQEAE